MSVPNLPDFTRWNRAALPEFHYVGANAAVVMDLLRSAHIAAFLRGVPAESDGSNPRDPFFWHRLGTVAGAQGKPQDVAAELIANRQALAWQDLWKGLPADGHETAAERNKRLRSSYEALPMSMTAEISRSFARAVHVLLGHASAFAGEGYIRTATQRASVVRLASMVGYQPAPAASASMQVALIADGKARASRIRKGMAAAMKNAEGRSVIFETTSDVIVHPSLNAIRFVGHDKDTTVIDISQPRTWLRIAGRAAPTQGEIAIAVMGRTGEACLVSGFSDTKDGKALIRLQASQLVSVVSADIRILCGSTSGRKPRMSAASGNSMLFSAHGTPLQTGALTFVRMLSQTQRYTAVVTEVDGDRIALEGLPAEAANAASLELQVATPIGMRNQAVRSNEATLFSVSADGTISEREGAEESAGNAKIYSFSSGFGAHFSKQESSDRIELRHVDLGQPYANANVDRFAVFDGTPPNGLITGAWMAVRTLSGSLHALSVTGISVSAGSYAVTFDQILPSGEPTHGMTFYGPFLTEFRPEGYDVAKASLDSNALKIPVLPAEAMALLRPGRSVILEDTRAPGDAEAGERPVAPALASVITAVSEDNSLGRTVTLSNAAGLSAFGLGYCQLRANAVGMSHGETRSAKVIGSGDGSIALQRIVLGIPDLSFIPDPAASCGFSPDMSVSVDDQPYLKEHSRSPAQGKPYRYEVSTQLDGSVEIIFGGKLPTAPGNIVLTSHRVGSGTSGNGFGPYAMTKPKIPDAVVAAIVQPFASSGGADAESARFIREHAPRHLRAMDRAVAAADFATLAQLNASVREASAEGPFISGSRRIMRLAIVPADGMTLPADALGRVREYVNARCSPGIAAEVANFTPIRVTIDVRLQVDLSRFDGEETTALVTETLNKKFGLANRSLGKVLSPSDIMLVADAVAGVLSSRAIIAVDPADNAEVLRWPDNTVRLIRCPFHSVIFAQPMGISASLEAAR